MFSFKELKNNIRNRDLPKWMRQKEVVRIQVTIKNSELEQPPECPCGRRMEITEDTYLFGEEHIVAASSLAFRCPKHREMRFLSNNVLAKFTVLVRDVYEKKGLTDVEMFAANNALFQGVLLRNWNINTPGNNL